MNLPPDLILHNLPPDAMDDYELGDGESANSAIYDGGHRNRLLITINSTLAPIVIEAGRAALRVSLPDDGHIRVGETPKSRHFEFTGDGNNAWTLAPKSRFAFDAKRPIRFNLLGVTVEGEVAGHLQVDPLGLAGWSDPLVAPLLVEPKPRREARDLNLKVTIEGRKAVYFGSGDFETRKNDPYQAVILQIMSGASERIETLPADWHVRIFASYGDRPTDLVPVKQVGFLGLETVNAFENEWAMTRRRQENAVTFDFKCQNGTFLDVGAGDSYLLRLTGILPDAADPARNREGIAKLFVEYRNLKDFRSGVASVPIWKKLRPEVKLTLDSPDTVVLDDPAKGVYGQFKVSWNARHIERKDNAVVINVGEDQGVVVKAGRPLLKAAGKPTVRRSTWGTSEPEGAAIVEVKEDRVLTAIATDEFGRSAEDNITVHVVKPKMTILEFSATPNPAPVDNGREADVLFSWRLNYPKFVSEILLYRGDDRLKVKDPARSSQSMRIKAGTYVLRVVDSREGMKDLEGDFVVKGYIPLLSGRTFEMQNKIRHGGFDRPQIPFAFKGQLTERLTLSAGGKCVYYFESDLSVRRQTKVESGSNSRSCAGTWEVNGPEIVAKVWGTVREEVLKFTLESGALVMIQGEQFKQEGPNYDLLAARNIARLLSQHRTFRPDRTMRPVA